MTCSPARIEANRRNAARSTGPRTEEGKSRSRLNAFRHGLAGFGDLLGPGDDAREVDARAAEIAEENGARDRTGRILARRAAAMSLRLERAEEHALVASAARAQAARDEFDRERMDELGELIAELAGGDDPRPALVELEGSPEGARFLAESWAEILDGVRAGGDDGRARGWLGLDGSTEASTLIERAEAERVRLRRLAVEFEGTAARAIQAARHRAGVLASFDSTVEGERARRHEAAAERSFLRALKAIAEHRATHADLPVPTSVLMPPPPPRRPAPAPPRPDAAALGSFPLGEPRGLGSFRLDDSAPGIDDLLGLPGRRAAAPGTPEARRGRPDLARVAAGRR